MTEHRDNNPALTRMLIYDAEQRADATDEQLMRVSGRVWAEDGDRHE